MPQFRTCLVSVVIAAFLTFAYASAVVHPQARSPQDVSHVQNVNDKTNFDRLLAQVSDRSLHEVLHKYLTSRYQHGIFREDRNAVEAIHKDNPAVATSLVELARRQATNATATSTTPVVPVTPTTPLTTTTPEPNTPPPPPPPTTPSTTSTTPVIPTTPATTAPSVPTTTLAPSPSTTPPSPTTTPTTTSTTSTTTTPNAETTAPPPTTTGVKSQSVIYTTTLPNGARSTVTYVTVIPANSVAATPGVTATGAPSLQNSGVKYNGQGWMVGAGAVAFAMAL